MGASLYGSFISFQALASLGSMGDLGLGGAVGIETNRLLGARKLDELKGFLSLARSVFIVLSICATLIFAALAPWAPGWLGFREVAGGGSATLLFLVGALSIGVTILGSYTAALSYACGNLTWPVLPSLFMAQASLGIHWWLASVGAPLWLQFLPYLGAAIGSFLLPSFYQRISHPELAGILPLHFAWVAARGILARSFWVYLWSLGSLVYTMTDRLVINRFFGPEETARYYLNYKPSELAVFTLATLTFVSLIKILQWNASPDAADRQQAIAQTLRLQKVQIFLGVAASLAYLGLNDLFIRVWLGPGHEISFVLQGLFAANLAVTVCGDAGTKIAGQITARGTVLAGIAVGSTALINLVFSWVAAMLGFIPGIALATLMAQSFFTIFTGCFAARALGLSRAVWVLKGWALPVAALATGFLLRWQFQPQSVPGVLLVGGAYLIITGIVGILVGINRELVMDELRIVRSMLGR